MNADHAIRQLVADIGRAAAAFESRWTIAALRRVDPDLCARLLEQRALTDEALVTGSLDEARKHAAAMCRGYAAVARRLDEAKVEDDAYLVGFDSTTGTRIAIGEQRAAAERVREIHGERIVWVTPDELAALVASLEAFKAIALVKSYFPGAEYRPIDTYADQPAKADAPMREDVT